MPENGRRPRILVITRNLPPLVGGMERLNWHMADELSRYAEVRIVGPCGSAALAPAGIDVREVRLQPVWKFLLQARATALTAARSWRPDIVLAGSGLTAPIAYAAAKTVGAKAAAYVHGLDVALRNRIYQWFWLPALRRMDCIIANSNATARLCRDIGIDGEKIHIVHPGVKMPTDIEKACSETAVDVFRERYGLRNRSLLLTVGRLSERKGMREFVVKALPRIVATHPDVTLLIVGDAPTQALHAQAQTPASIQSAADVAGVGHHVRFLGVITDFAELGAVYRASDVHVFPVRSIPGDPEGFGMVAVEAAAHGLPTVAFATGGTLDAVSDGVSGRLIPFGDYVGMAETVCDILDDGDGWAERSVGFAHQFAWSMFGKKVQSVLFPEDPPRH